MGLYMSVIIYFIYIYKASFENYRLFYQVRLISPYIYFKT